MILNEGEIIMEAAELTAREKSFILERKMEELLEQCGKCIDAETREMMCLAYIEGYKDAKEGK